MVGSLSNRWDQMTTSKPLQTPFTESPVHRIPSEIPRCWRGLIPPDKPVPLGGPLPQVSPHSALHLLTQMGRSPPERLGRGERETLRLGGPLGTTVLLIKSGCGETRVYHLALILHFSSPVSRGPNSLATETLGMNAHQDKLPLALSYSKGPTGSPALTLTGPGQSYSCLPAWL